MAETPSRRAGSGRSRVPYGLRLAIGPAILLAILATLDRGALLDTFRQADPMLLVAAYLMPFPAIALRTWRWRILLGTQARSWTAVELLCIYARSIAAGVLTPGRLGEFAKAVLVARRGTSFSAALWSTVVDRVADLAFLAVLAAGALPLIALAPDEGRVLVWLIASAAVAGAAGLWALGTTQAAAPLRARLLGLASRRLRNESGNAEVETDHSASSIAPGAAVATVALTVASWAVTYAATYLYSRALGIPIGYMEIAGISALCSLVASLPISIAGAGTRDATLVLVLARYGVDRAHAVALSTLMLSGVLWVGAVCALAFLVGISGARRGDR